MDEINFNDIISIVETSRKNAYIKVNEEMVLMYYDFGKYLSENIARTSWGEKIIEKLADFMKKEYPSLKGFKVRGLYRMKQFYETYKEHAEIVSTLLTQLNWSNHIKILSSTNTINQKEFYMKLAIKYKYSTRELARQIDSAYYERYMLSNGEAALSNIQSIDEEDMPNFKILDTYSLEFLDLPNNYSELDLKHSIISNLKNFIFEVGKDFTFVGEEYRIQVGTHDYYIDLLFFNRELSCLVAFELKTDEFKSEYISKMDFYLEALDRDVKKSNEKPSIGIILCAKKDSSVVEYSMSRNISPTQVSEYKLKLIDRKILENKLNEITEMLDR